MDRPVAPGRAVAFRRSEVEVWSRRARAALAPGRTLPRVLAGLAAGLVAGALGAAEPEAGRIRPAAGLAFAAGAGFGAAGAVAFAAGQLAVLLLVGQVPWVALLFAVSDCVLGLVAWLAFRDGGRVGRGLPDLRSYLWFVAVALVGSLATAMFLAWSDLDARFLESVGLFAVGNLTGVVLVALPLLVLVDLGLRRWSSPIPGEVRAGPLRPVGDGVAGLPAPFEDAEATVLVSHGPDRSLRKLALSAAAVLGITVLAAPLAAVSPAGGSWLAVLYLVPVVGAAHAFGLRGGALAASVSGVLFLAVVGLVASFAGEVPAESQHLALYAQLLLLSPLGAYLGQARQRELGLRSELSVQNRLLHDDLMRVVNALTAAIEAKDSYTEAHLRRVGDYAVETGARLGLVGRDLETLHYAAMLHDIGKIGVPETVLRKSGPLDDAEREHMERHPEIGAKIVSGLDLLRDAAPLILHHQERWDGGANGAGGGYRGYPSGLSGDAIPLGARIIAVVDAFDAMTTDRPYRPALPVDEAVDELRAEAGRQFDPRVVETFLAVVAERPWA